MSSLKRIFGGRKRSYTRRMHRDRPITRFKQAWLDRPQYESIASVAIAEGRTITSVLHDVVGTGLAHYLGNKIAQYERDEKARREMGLRAKRNEVLPRMRREAARRGLSPEHPR